MIEIEAYQLSYHPEKGCHFRFRLRGNPQWQQWIRVSAADLAAVAAVLNEKPVYFNPASGSILTGDEPTGA
jgi:hypothetical protein